MAKLLLYCTKRKPDLYQSFEHDCFQENKESKYYLTNYPIIDENDIKLNGKIVAECKCELVEEILFEIGSYIANPECPEDSIFCEEGYYDTKRLSEKELCNKSCLSFDQLDGYLWNRCGHALHLKNINIFDESKELSDYYQIKGTHKNLFGEIVNEYQPLKKAPQNMCYVYDKHSKEWCILLSIRSKPLCQILNGEKTIEVRRMILNELKELIR